MTKTKFFCEKCKQEKFDECAVFGFPGSSSPFGEICKKCFLKNGHTEGQWDELIKITEELISRK